MDRKTVLEALEQLRRIHFGVWRTYKGYVDEDRNCDVFRETRDKEDRNVRVLDYIITEVRKLDAV